MGFLVALIVGGLAGWLASMVVKDGSLGIIGNVVVGFLGAVLVNLFGGNSQLSNPTWGGFFEAVLGAIVLLVVVNLFTHRSAR